MEEGEKERIKRAKREVKKREEGGKEEGGGR